MWLYIWQLLAQDLLATHHGRQFHTRLQYRSGPSTGTGPQAQLRAIMNTTHTYLMSRVLSVANAQAWKAKMGKRLTTVHENVTMARLSTSCQFHIHELGSCCGKVHR